MAPAWLAFYDGIIALVLVALGLLGAHFYLISPFVGFSLVFVWGLLLSLIGTIVALYARHRYRGAGMEFLRRRATVGLIMSAIVAVPVLLFIARGLTAKVPPINDITTDIDNPLEFVAVEKLPATPGFDMKYDKAKYAERQQAGYGVMAPMKEQIDPAATFARVQEVALKSRAWTIVVNDPATMTVEGFSTSKTFRFIDYFIIQVRPAPGGGSMISMRSKSRYGIGDFGINHRRIQRFFDRMALARPETTEEDLP